MRLHILIFLVLYSFSPCANIPEDLEKFKTCQKLVLQGRKQFLEGDKEGAEMTFLQVQKLSPNDPSAKYFLNRISYKNTPEGKNSRSGYTVMEEVRSPPCSRKGVDVSIPRTKSLRERLNETTIPSIDVKSIPLAQVLASLDSTCQPDITALPYCIRSESRKEPLVTVKAQGESLQRVLELIAESIGFRCEISNIITFKPAQSQKEPSQLNVLEGNTRE